MPKLRPMAFVTKPGKVEIWERPIPALGPNDVQISVKAVTICGSDLHIFRGKHPSVELPIPVGHEISGEISCVGEKVSRFQPGDRVTVEPVIICGECIFCQRGDYHLCANISFQYRVGQGGITTEFIAPEMWVHPLPQTLSFTEGALIEPLAVALHAVRRANLDPGSTVAIFGAGPIGLLILMVSQAVGAGKVIITDIREPRLETARDLGADLALNGLGNNVVEAILAITGGIGAQVGFESAGIHVTLKQMLAAVEKGGTGVLVGLYEESEAAVPVNLLVQREITLMGTQGYQWDFQRAIKLVGSGRLDLSKLVTHKFSIDDAQKAFDMLEDSASQAIKVVIQP